MGVLVDLQRVNVKEPDRFLIKELSLTISDGDRLGVVGLNGTGKSTLLRVIGGRLRPDDGVIHRSRAARIGFLDQRPTLGHGSVRSILGEGWEIASLLDRLGATALLDRDVTSLSGGQAKRVALAKALTSPSELLILDEPTNHLDLAGVAWLERWLASYAGGLVIVSHDRHLLDRLTTRMLELDRGTGYLYEDGYSSYLEAKAEREELIQSAEATRRNLARGELAWLRRGAKARSRKPRARTEAAKMLLGQPAPDQARATELELHVTMPRLGGTVIEFSNVSHGFADGQNVIKDVDLLIGPGDRLGILGANGSGKSTILNLITGRELPRSGRMKIGKTVRIGYYDQHGTTLDLGARVQDVVAGPHRQPGSLEDVALMKRFWFTGNLPYAKVADLSGGERRRLQLLEVLATQPNVLLLDEPTNDLDLDTLRVLEDFLEDWPGTLIVVSHDRVFLERTIDMALAIGADGRLGLVPGGVDGLVSSQIEPAPTARRSPDANTANLSVKIGEEVALGRRLRELEKRVARLNQRQDELNVSLVASSDRSELIRLGGELKTVRTELAQAEDRWFELAERLEGSD